MSKQSDIKWSFNTPLFISRGRK